jgi:hypothetical protein
MVIDIEAEPIAGAILVLTYGEETDSTENVFKQRSNERGYFEFNDLSRGVYLLKVHMEGYKEWHRELKLPAGETIKIEVKLEKLEERPKQEENNETEPVYGAVFGYVFNAVENEPIVGAIVIIHHIESDREIKLETNERGWFEVKLPRGKYVYVVEARGFWPVKEELLVKGNDEQKLRIPMRPREPEVRPTLCGHIFDAVTDKPIFGWVEISQGSPKIPGPNMDKKRWYEEKDINGKTRQAENENDRPIEEESENNEIAYGKIIGYVYNALEEVPIGGAIVIIRTLESERELKFETNERGMFEAKLPRGKYVIVVEARGFWPYKEELIVRGNDEQKLRTPLKPKEVEEPEKPEKPEDYRLWRTFTDRGGWYEYFEIPPGHYEIRAFAHGHRMFYNEIDIEENSHIYLDIYLLREHRKSDPKPEPIPWSVLSGHVFNKRTQDPVAGAVVCAIPMKLIKERFIDLGVDLDEMGLDEIELNEELLEKLGLNDFDWENFEYDKDMDFDPNENEKPDEDWENKEKPEEYYEKERYEKEQYEKEKYEKEQYDKDEKDPDPGQKTRCCKDDPNVERKKVREYLSKFCTRTNDDGNFRLKLPAGAYLLIVKARGYQLFYQSYKIEPKEQKFIRVPLIPMLQRPITDDINDNESERPKRPEQPDRLQRPEAKNNDDPDSASETTSLGSSVAGGAAGTSAVLYGVLGILILIAVILGSMVWRKGKVTPIRKKRKLKTIKF